MVISVCHYLHFSHLAADHHMSQNPPGEQHKRLRTFTQKAAADEATDGEVSVIRECVRGKRAGRQRGVIVTSLRLS